MTSSLRARVLYPWLALHVILGSACRPALENRGRNRDLLLAFESEGRIAVPGVPRDPKDYAHIQNVTAAGVERTAIFVHPPASVSFDVRLLPGARFESWVGIDDRAVDKGTDGVTFHVTVASHGKTLRAFELRLDPRAPEGRGWHPASLDLGDLAGRHATLTLSTDPGGEPSNDWAGFATPRIVSEGEPIHVAPFAEGSVVLVSLDTLRVDRLGAYGNAEPLTPGLDALSRKLALYPDAMSPSHWTLPAHMSLFTSLHADVHGVDVHRALPEGIPLLTTVLHGAGYATAGFPADVGWLGPEYGFGRGFDLYMPTVEDTAARIDRVAEHLEKLGGRKVFAFVHFYDAHSDYGSVPYDASPEALAAFAPDAAGFPGCKAYRCAGQVLQEMNHDHRRYSPGDEARMREMYEAGLSDLDHELSRLLCELRGVGLFDRALFAIFSDHGEELGDHGMYLHDQGYTELTRVLLGLRIPGQSAGLRSGMASLVDVAPTLLSHAGIRPPASWQGVDLVSFAPASAYTVTEFGDVLLRDARSSIFRTADGRTFGYDLEKDPGEVTPLFAPVDPALVAKLTATRALHCQAASALGPRPPLNVSEEERQQAMAGGYNDPGRRSSEHPCQ